MCVRYSDFHASFMEYKQGRNHLPHPSPSHKQMEIAIQKYSSYTTDTLPRWDQ